MTLWHYTTGKHMEAILRTGALLPSGQFAPGGEPAGVWFTPRDDWEPTAGKMLQGPDGRVRSLGRDEIHELCDGLVRVGVPRSPGLKSWAEFCRLCRSKGVKAKYLRALEKGAVVGGSDPATWYVSLGPVPQPDWQQVERWTGAEWEAWDPQP